MPSKDQITREQKALPREFFVILRPAGDQLALVSYWGSKEYDRLKALRLRPGGDDRARHASSRWSCRCSPPCTGSTTTWSTNYGWAIVLLTILIKLVLLPLTHRSTMSMRKMQELNPKVQAIRDRYRTKLRDKQGKPNLEAQRKMNEEVMAIYKEAGVNPAGGCLPLLIQMPILFAFYRLLSTAVDLRNAPWLLWIQDLSVHDPYYVLPIIMGVTQLLQVRMGPAGGRPDAAADVPDHAGGDDLLLPRRSQRAGALLAHQQRLDHHPTPGLQPYAGAGGVRRASARETQLL